MELVLGWCYWTTELGTFATKYSWVTWEHWLGNTQGSSWCTKCISIAFKQFHHRWRCFYFGSAWGMPIWQGNLLLSYFLCYKASHLPCFISVLSVCVCVCFLFNTFKYLDKYLDSRWIANFLLINLLDYMPTLYISPSMLMPSIDVQSN